MDNTNTLPAVQETQEDKDLKFVENGIALFQQAPLILRDNKSRVDKALAACQAFLNTYAENGYLLDEETDKAAMELLVKINKTAALLKTNREPVTQIFDAVKKLFTAMEGKLSLKEVANLPAQIQKARDEYAKWCVEEELRKKKEAEEKAAMENEKADLKAWITTKIGELLSNYIANKKTTWTNSFNAITLQDFAEKEAKIHAVSTAFDKIKLADITKIAALPHTPRLELLVKLVVQNDAMSEYDFESWINDHNMQFEELKRKLIDSLPSKKAELEEAARIKAEQEAAAAKAAEEDRIRNEAMAKANAEEKARLEAEASKARIEEMERQKALKEQEEKLAAEKAQREAAEAAKIKAEQEAAAAKAAELAEASKSAAVAANLFDSSLAMADTANTPETRQGFNIIVTNPAGYAEMVSMWFSREGMKLGVDELEKVTFGKIKKYWESVAQKTSEKITSKFLKYEIAVKAVNRKEK